MKIRELFNLRHALLATPRGGMNTKLAYAIKKNLRKIGAEVQDAEELLRTVPADLQEYNEKREALCVEYSRRDDDGKPVIVNNEYQFTDRDAFDAALQPLLAEYHDQLAEREAAVKAIMDVDAEIKFHLISVDDLPEGLSEQDIEILLPFIREDD